MKTILGFSASLRGARQGKGTDDLCADIIEISSVNELINYLEAESKSLATLYEAAHAAGQTQLENLAHLSDGSLQNGLSNSEVGLAAALWGAHSEGCRINYCNLSRYFPESGSNRHLNELEKIILQADGFILAGPVYFGDRSSVAQEFIEFLNRSSVLKAHMKDKVFGGIAVGAKRNGGQETCLIYQLIDLINLNMLGVGNDYHSTSQYGGTIVAGDVGTAAKDQYGINTSIDTGRRVAQVTNLLKSATSEALSKTKIEIWLVQDDLSQYGLKNLQQFIKGTFVPPNVHISIRDLTNNQIHRCIACDICPISKGEKQEYRCIITKKEDLFRKSHNELMDVDGILIAAFSPINKENVMSVYQKFVERTRYLRRDNYALGDILVAPLIISEINSNQNLHLRMVTSFIRHHTIIHHPVLIYKNEDCLIGIDQARSQLLSFINITENLKVRHNDIAKTTDYNPVGYILSAHKS